MITQPFVFKEWLPDQPELGNQGLLEATNVIPSSRGYTPFRPLDDSGATVASTANGVNGAFVANANTANATGRQREIFFNNNQYYVSGAGSTLGSLSTRSAVFAQYEDEVLAAGGFYHGLACVTVIASTRQFAAVTSAPYASTVDVVGQFVVAGYLWDAADGTLAFGGSGTAKPLRPNYVQWSAIDDPLNWPEPGSATAIAAQSGQQAMKAEFGPVMAIKGGDQFAVIFQANAVSRMLYIGGSSVFQFDTIATMIGCKYLHGSARVGGVTYFVSQHGFHRTDGTGVENIGEGKVNETWKTDLLSATEDVSCAYDPVNECVCWGMGNKIYYYHPMSNSWSRCNQNHMFIVSPSFQPDNPGKMIGWSDAGIRGDFAGTVGSAVFTTGEVEMKPGGYAHLSGFKPLISGSTAVSMTVAVGTRNGQDTAPSFTSETSVNSRTGFADFRSEARYHRTRVTITGDFEKAIGGEFKAAPSGEV